MLTRITQFYPPTARLSTNGTSHTYLSSPATEHHRTLAGTHFPSCWAWKAELACVAGHKPRWFACPQMVSHPSTNCRTRRRVSSLIETSVLPVSHGGKIRKTCRRPVPHIPIFLTEQLEELKFTYRVTIKTTFMCVLNSINISCIVEMCVGQKTPARPKQSLASHGTAKTNHRHGPFIAYM